MHFNLSQYCLSFQEVERKHTQLHHESHVDLSVIQTAWEVTFETIHPFLKKKKQTTGEHASLQNNDGQNKLSESISPTPYHLIKKQWVELA